MYNDITEMHAFNISMKIAFVFNYFRWMFVILFQLPTSLHLFALDKF